MALPLQVPKVKKKILKTPICVEIFQNFSLSINFSVVWITLNIGEKGFIEGKREKHMPHDVDTYGKVLDPKRKIASICRMLVQYQKLKLSLFYNLSI